MNTIQRTILLLFISLQIAVAQDESAPTAASLYNQGLEQLKAKSYSEAYELLMQAIEAADPESDAQVLNLAKRNGAIAAYYVGSEHLKAKSYQEAGVVFEQGIKLDTSAYTNYYGAAKALDDSGQLIEAVEAYLKAADVAAADSKAADRAERYLSRAVNILGTSSTNKKCDVTIKGGELYLASHESKDVNYYLAKCFMEAGRKDDALAHAKLAHGMGGTEDEGKYVMLMAEVLESAGRKSEAADMYGKVPAGKYRQQAQYRAGQLK